MLRGSSHILKINYYAALLIPKSVLIQCLYVILLCKIKQEASKTISEE